MVDLSLISIDLIITSLTTLIAVLIGYGLSRIAENKAWDRRKIELLRDKQLASVLTLTKKIHNVNEIITPLINKLDDYLFIIEGKNLSKAEKNIKVGMVQGKLNSIINDIKPLYDDTISNKIELELIGYKDPGFSNISLNMKCFRRIICILYKLFESINKPLIITLKKELKTFQKLEKNIIKTARDSLYE